MREILIACGFETDFSFALKNYANNVFESIEAQEKFLEPGTRAWLVKEALLLLDTNRVISVVGTAGVGKTVFAAALSLRLLKKDELGAIYFIKYSNRNLLCGKHVIYSIASQLCRNIPDFTANLTETNIDKSLESLLKLGLSQIFEYLVLEPLSREKRQDNVDARIKVIILDGLEQFL
uniref:Nephrocystin 3-like N-terminal domain-containing protein n=1 Tax=Aplanochytrium stocchinoi TaxID=215587 RepID=A0A7S3PBQ9_9STRA